MTPTATAPANPDTTTDSRYQGLLEPALDAYRSLQDDLDELDRDAERILAEVKARLEAQARRGIRAWLLAPTIEVYVALMNGESVPAELLDQAALRRYGRRA